MTAAVQFPQDAPLPVAGLHMRVLVGGEGYDIRRVLAGPGERHGPNRYGGDAMVCVLGGAVTFEVNDRTYSLRSGDVLWVPAGEPRAFQSGPQGAELIAIHLPLRQ